MSGVKARGVMTWWRGPSLLLAAARVMIVPERVMNSSASLGLDFRSRFFCMAFRA